MVDACGWNGWCARARELAAPMTVAGSVFAISVKSCGALLLLSPDGIATGVKQHGAIGRDSMRPDRNQSTLAAKGQKA